MTFCLGVKTAQGLVAISDRRITSGSEVSSEKKLSVHQVKNHSLFIMTAGLRSVRDKAITYFQEVLDKEDNNFDKLFLAVNAFGNQLKRVAQEDKESLVNAGLRFNLSAIVGGQLQNDKEHKLFLLYPEGNWIEVTEGSQFIIIGNSGYGKPILYRNIKYSSPFEEVLKLGFLAFDSTRVSANDFVAIAVGVSALLTSLLLALRWVIKSYLAELKPNSGSSMKDQLTRLEQRVDDLFLIMSKRQ
jgi:putative proteasome-type protease